MCFFSSKSSKNSLKPCSFSLIKGKFRNSIKNFFLFIKELIDYNSLYFNLKLLKNIFMESNEIIELIQENKNDYCLEDKEFEIIGF